MCCLAYNEMPHLQCFLLHTEHLIEFSYKTEILALEWVMYYFQQCIYNPVGNITI